MEDLAAVKEDFRKVMAAFAQLPQVSLALTDGYNTTTLKFHHLTFAKVQHEFRSTLPTLA